ncbi:MAG: hypothetical protein A2X94_14650 [Bdellovibrionales bacterium GWB1_55_8]|nr:MAG: hypothetical protein A2X94_14650 [Bdellovibrionales bacterium GWB1_55_8]
MKKISELLKAHFFAGILVLIPLAVIAWILVGAGRTLWKLRQVLPEEWNPESILPDPTLAAMLNVALFLGVLLALAISISVLGWGSKHYLGKQALSALGVIIERIPVIRSVYSALDQLLKTLAAQGGQQFSRVVYVEYPRKGVWAIAFVTGPTTLPESSQNVPGPYLNIYVPTTPNPTSGFHLIVPESEVRESHLKVEEAFKVILSLGIAQPSARPERKITSKDSLDGN